jgi:hypothetical protein
VLTVPGSGAAAIEYGVRGVSAAPGFVYWLLRGTASEIWRWDPVTSAAFRATVRLHDLTIGFAQDGAMSYYVRPVADMPCVACDTVPHDIRRIDGLVFEPAPVLVLE